MYQPEQRVIRLRATQPNHQWAMEMMAEMQIHHRDGRKWIVIQEKLNQHGLHVTIQELIVLNFPSKSETKTMTTEIEKTKRALYDCLDRIRRAAKHRVLTAEFEERMEEHLEELRKDASAFQARIGELYSSRQQWQDIAADRLTNLSAMTDERNQLQERLHAVDRAYFEQSQRNGEQARQIEKLEELNRIAGEELIRAQGVARQYLDDCRSAEKHSGRFSEQLRDAQAVISHQEQLIVGQRLAIAELYMAKKQINIVAGGGRGVGPVQIGPAIVSNGAGYPGSGAGAVNHGVGAAGVRPEVGAGGYAPSSGAGGATGR